jgi:hypothetical protein
MLVSLPAWLLLMLLLWKKKISDAALVCVIGCRRRR